MNNETYFYGQGKIYLTRYDENDWRWIGDTSSLTVNLNFEEKRSRASVGGRLVTSRRYITAHGGSIDMSLHNHAPENLEILLHSKKIITRQSWAEEVIDNVAAGSCKALAKTNVRLIEIKGLTQGVDFTINQQNGLVHFIKAPENNVAIVSYDYSAAASVPLLSVEAQEFALRYEGVNLAEGGQTVFFELYKITFDPVSVIALINNGDSFHALDATAQILPDLSRLSRDEFGLFGRFIKADEFKFITYNNEINHDLTHDFAY